MAENTIDPQTQLMLNTPLALTQGFDPRDEAFLNQIVSDVEQGKIKLFVPFSLVNATLYETLPPKKKAVVDSRAFTTLAAIREIYNLWKTYKKPTYQLSNLITKVRLTKEEFETQQGDVFIV